jgi:PKD repeat protein
MKMSKYLKSLIFLSFVLLTNEISAVSVIGGSVEPTNGCAPLRVKLTANQADDIEEYRWEIERTTTKEKKVVYGPTTEALLKIPDTYSITLHVSDEEDQSLTSVVEPNIIVGEPCEETPPEFLEACFTLSILDGASNILRTFEMDDIWVANKKLGEGLKVRLDADCSEGNNITGSKWIVSDGKESYGNPSEIIFDKKELYKITLEITDIYGNTDSESRQISIGELCAEFDLSPEISFNEELKRLLNVNTCNPMMPSSSYVDFQKKISSNNTKCDKPTIDDDYEYITFEQPSAKKSCEYDITIIAEDANGLQASTSKLTRIQGTPSNVYFEIFKNGEKQPYYKKKSEFERVPKKEFKYLPEDQVKLDLVIDFEAQIGDCGSSASLFIAIKIEKLKEIVPPLGCINPYVFLISDKPFYSIEETDCEQPFFGPLFSTEYPRPYKYFIEINSDLQRETIVRNLVLTGAKGKYIFYIWLVQEGTINPIIDFESRCNAGFDQPYTRTINVEVYTDAEESEETEE